jgi:hypothetical protein
MQVYALTGQKRDTPAETDSSYKFYTSLRKQRPESEMAEVWCMEHGVLTAEVSERESQRSRSTPVLSEAKLNQQGLTFEQRAGFHRRLPNLHHSLAHERSARRVALTHAGTTGGLGLQEAENAYAALLKRKGRAPPDAKKAKAAPRAKTPAKSPASAAKGKVRPLPQHRAQLSSRGLKCSTWNQRTKERARVRKAQWEEQ